jgi:hypothetical protein
MFMRNRAIGLLAVAAGLLSVSLPALAHHGTAVFDTSKTLILKGTVTEWDWSNPHCLIQFDVKSEGGPAVHWIAETQNPAEMVSLGWGTASFKAGDELTVTLIPVKNGRPYGRIKQIALPDGKVFITIKEGLTPKDPSNPPPPAKSDNYPKL